MKRALFETVAVLPLVSGSVVQRTGYESAVLALTVAQNATATVKVEHCDTQDGTFEAVFVDNPVNESGEAIVKNEGPAAAVANLDIDLVGCKEFIKITVTGGTAGALALGDAIDYPVHQVTAIAPASSGTGG